MGTVSLYFCFSGDSCGYAVLIHDVEMAKCLSLVAKCKRQLSSVFTILVSHISPSVLLQGEEALSSQVALSLLPTLHLPLPLAGTRGWLPMAAAFVLARCGVLRACCHLDHGILSWLPIGTVPHFWPNAESLWSPAECLVAISMVQIHLSTVSLDLFSCRKQV